MKVNNSRILCLLLISFSLINSGCSVIGFGLGAVADFRNFDKGIVKPEDYKTIKNLQKITVYLNDNSAMVGYFDGVFDQHLVLQKKSLHDWKFHHIKLDDINSIEIKSNRNGKINGFIFGLALDVLIFLLVFYRLKTVAPAVSLRIQ